MATVACIHAYVIQEDRPILVPRARPVSPIPLPSRRSPENLLRAPLSSQSNVIHLLTLLPLQEIIFLLRRAGHESKTTRDRDIIEQANSPRKFGGSEWRRLDDDVEARRGEARRYVDPNSKKEMMESKRQRGGRVLRTRRSPIGGSRSRGSAGRCVPSLEELELRLTF